MLSGAENQYLEAFLQAANGGSDVPAKDGGDAGMPYKSIMPKPGFCLKTKTKDDEKVFINVCHAENLPEPKDISDEELVELLNSEDPGSFRVPMSLGEPHAELDHNDHGCIAYDVVVNPFFFQKLEKRQLLLGFFLTVVLEGIEHKYSTSLSREWKILKNRKCLGSLPEQRVRTKSQPLIMEMNAEQSSSVSTDSSQTIKKKKGACPPYTIMKEPPTGDPEYMVAEIHLPKIKSAASVTVDIGEDRLLLQTRADVYYLDIYLPYTILQDDCGAQFNKTNKILTITMPVIPEALN